MAKVRLLVSVAGEAFSWIPGQVVEMDDAEAAKWADGVRGELVGEESAPPAASEVEDGPAPVGKRRKG